MNTKNYEQGSLGDHRQSEQYLTRNTPQARLWDIVCRSEGARCYTCQYNTDQCVNCVPMELLTNEDVPLGTKVLLKDGRPAVVVALSKNGQKFGVHAAESSDIFFVKSVVHLETAVYVNRFLCVIIHLGCFSC